MTSFTQSNPLLCTLMFAALVSACGDTGASSGANTKPSSLEESRADIPEAEDDEDAETCVSEPGDGDGEPGQDGEPENDGDAGQDGEPENDGDAGQDGEPDDENVVTLAGGIVERTIVVLDGQVFDGRGQRYIAGSALGDGSQSEDQLPVFKLEDGAQLRNVVLGSPAADGVHCHGDVRLENVVWEDIGEDALTVKKSGTVVIDGGSATNGDDKVFQINAASTFQVSNFRASHAGKFIRQNGGTDFEVNVIIDRCDISFMDEAVFRTDSDISSVTMTNTRTSEIGDALFIGVNPDLITTEGNTED